MHTKQTGNVLHDLTDCIGATLAQLFKALVGEDDQGGVFRHPYRGRTGLMVHQRHLAHGITGMQMGNHHLTTAFTGFDDIQATTDHKTDEVTAVPFFADRVTRRHPIHKDEFFQ